ncbi:MAG: LemA family protein [Thermoplasmatota archaeon]
MDPVVAVIGVVALLVLFGVPLIQFNRMATLRNRCAESWADVDTELRRRHDLIPNLVSTVQGYAAHEKAVLAAVTQARARLVGGSQATRAADENALVAALSQVFAIAERYPDLKASANFLALQNELVATEDRIQAARRFYNANVRDYENQIRTFPGALFSRRFGFSDRGFFEIDSPSYREAPVVQLPGVA